MHPVRPCLLLLITIAAPVVAQPPPPTAAESAALRDAAGSIRQQPLSTGRETGRVDIAVPPGETPVTIRSLLPAPATAGYRLHFAALDSDGDGLISRDEAQANPSLAGEFDSLDTKRRGGLDRADLAGWLLD